MGIQSVREAVSRFTRLCDHLTIEKGITVEREAKWEQARTVDYWLNDLLYRLEWSYIVATGKTPAKHEQQEWKGFVNYVLSDEDKTQYSTWNVDDHDLWLLVAGHQQCGYKLSVSFNAKNDTFSATYLCNDEQSANKGYCLSAFAPDWYNAVKILAFKHDVVLDGNWVGKESKPKNNWG